MQDRLDNWQPRGTPCGPISSRACKPHLMTPPASQGFGYWESMSTYGTTRTDAAGAHVNSPASWTTRGKDHPTARLLDLVPGRSGTAHENWLEERGEQFRSGIQIATLDPFQGYKNAIDDQLQDATSVLNAFHIVKLAGDALDEVRRRVQQDTTGHRGRKGDPLYQIRNLLRASRDRLTKRQKERLRAAFTADEAHFQCRSRLPAHPASARGLPSSHTRPRPTPGRTPHPAPTNVSHPRNRSPGPNPTQVEGRTRCLLRYWQSQQRTPPKPSTQIIELGRRTTRGYPNPTNYQLRILLITGGLDAPTHTQL